MRRVIEQRNPRFALRAEVQDIQARQVLVQTVAGAARMAAECGARTLIIPGALAPGWEAVLEYADAVEPVAGSVLTAEEAMARPAETLSMTVERALAGWLRMREVEAGGAAAAGAG